jgi:hypothetical protein
MKKGYIIILILVAVVGIITCVYLPSQFHTTSGLTAQQKNDSIKILQNNQLISDVSNLGEPERFGIGHDLFNMSRTLALVPLIQSEEQNISVVFMVDIDRNTTIGEFWFDNKSLSYDHVKTLINLTVDSPIVNDSFWDSNLIFITANYSDYTDTAPTYMNWPGRFVTASISMDDPNHQFRDGHKITVIIDDTVPRVISVSDLYTGSHYDYSPVYAVLPPGKEKIFEIAGYPYFPTNESPYKWCTGLTIEPLDAKVYPLIFEESNYQTIRNDTPDKALTYVDFMTNKTERYAGDSSVSSGWWANITLDHNAYIHMILKNTDPNNETIVEVKIAADREMGQIIYDKFRNNEKTNSI